MGIHVICRMEIRAHASNSKNGRSSAFVVEASFTMPISADTKTKSAINATRRVTKRTSVAVTVNQVVEMARKIGKHTSHGDNRRGELGRIHDVSHDHQGDRTTSEN